MTVPPPRRALALSDDGTVQVAAPHVSSLAVDPAAVVKSRKKSKKKAKGKSPDDDVELVVVLSKRDRKRLRRKAAGYGWSPEEAAAHILRVWAED